MTKAASTKPKRIAPRKAVDHSRGLRSSTQLTSWWYEARKLQGFAGKQIKPSQVISALNKASVPFVLIGAHAIAGWLRGEAHSSSDVDVLVREEHHRVAVRVLQKAFPHLAIQDAEDSTCFIDPDIGVAVIDLVKPRNRVHTAVFANTIHVGKTHEIPDLEMALAMKFAAIKSPHRTQSRKLRDAGDYGNMVVENATILNRDKLRTFADLVCRAGGRKAIALAEAFLNNQMIAF